MAIEFNLPGSSFEEVSKIVKGYANAQEKTSLDSLSKLTGQNPSTLSRNSKFLTDIGLIVGGTKKTATDLGKKLGRALEHSQDDDSRRFWKEAVQSNEKIAGLITTVRIKGGMPEKDFSEHVLYVSGQQNTHHNMTGARCVTDVLLAAKLLEEVDGVLKVASPKVDQETTTDSNPSVPISAPSSPATPSPIAHASEVLCTQPQIAINIQLHLPETENSEVYEKLFKALRENLFPSME